MLAISELLGEESIDTTLSLAPEEGRLRARFYQAGAVLQESSDDEGKTLLQLRLPRMDFIRILQDAGMDPLPWLPAVAEDPAADLAGDTTAEADAPPLDSATLDEAV
jgi:GTP-binding protein HflX